MAKQKKKIKWPEHASWWDRNKAKVIYTLIVILIILLILVQILTDIVNDYPYIALIWVILFSIDVFLLTILVSSPND